MVIIRFFSRFSSLLRPPRPQPWLWFLILAGTTASVFGAPTLSATVDPAEMGLGGFAAYSITVTGGNPDGASELSLPEGLELAASLPSRMSQTSINNGRISNSVTWIWQITANKVGEYTIPPQEMHVDGRPYQSNAVKITVKEKAAGSPAPQYDPLMTIELPKREIYVGEVVPIMVNLYVHRLTMLRRVGLIEIPKDNFAIARFPQQADENTVTMGGVPYRALTFQSTLSGLKPGKFKLGPATSEIILDVPSGDDRFQHPLFSMPSESRHIRPDCNDFTVTVLPLPDEGKPANFQGVVGDFELNVSAEPREVTVGEPITTVINISGTGNFDSLTVPALTEPAPWKIYPARRFQAEKSEGDPLSRQSIGFDQVLIPKSQVAAVPPFEFSYFSPTQKKYVTLRSSAIPLKVTAPEQAVEPPPVAASKDGKGASLDLPESVPQAQVRITDILAYTPTESKWLNPMPPLWKQHQFLVANLGAAGTLLLLLVGKLGYTMIYTRMHSPEAPLKRLWKSLEASDVTRGQFYNLAAAYAGARQKQGEEIDSIIHQHHQLNYALPTTASEEPIPADEKAKVLAALRD